MIQLTNYYHDSSIYVNPDLISHLQPHDEGRAGTVIFMNSGNSITVKEGAPTINSLIIADKRR